MDENSFKQDNSKQRLKEYLINRLTQSSYENWGLTNKSYIEQVAENWLNDKTNSKRRFDDLELFMGGRIPSNSRILDMACGCGTFGFYGLLHGLDTWGIDPEEWKHELIAMKCKAYGYPSNWKTHFLNGVGEALPFPDCHFDFISSYQTIEHVEDVEKCISEMLRVLRPGGAMFLRAPDYRSTYEGHYRLPWLPYFPRKLAKYYLRLLNRPDKGLSTINYVTRPYIKRVLAKHDVEIIDGDMLRIQKRLSHTPSYFKNIAFSLWKIRGVIFSLFRREFNMNLIVVKRS